MKQARLSQFFHEHPKAALAFSGGTDSAYLLWAGIQAGAQIQPYFIQTAFQPEFEAEDAKRLAEQLKVTVFFIPLDILSIGAVAENPKNRCYFCKHALFSAIKKKAQEDGFSLLLDGTNASDDSSDRPGMQALKELDVRSPLRECGITKEEIRKYSREAGLFTWNKPAYACLATRVETGRRITEDLLSMAEHGEEELFKMGFSDFRVRLFYDAARIQLPAEQFRQAVERRKEICQVLAPWFSAIFLDLNERR